MIKIFQSTIANLAALYNTMSLVDENAFLLRIETWTTPESPLRSLANFAIAERFIASDPVRAKIALTAIATDEEASGEMKAIAAQLTEAIDASAY